MGRPGARPIINDADVNSCREASGLSYSYAGECDACGAALGEACRYPLQRALESFARHRDGPFPKPDG